MGTLNLPDIEVGERRPMQVRTLSEAGFLQPDIDVLVGLTQMACKQITYGLPKGADELFPKKLPLFALSERQKKEAAGGACMRPKWHDPNASSNGVIVNDRISELQNLDFRGICI